MPHDVQMVDTVGMSVYVVIATNPPLDQAVAELFDEQNRSRAAPGVWFVRSSRLSTSDLMNDLGIHMEGNGGIIVAAENYNGVGPTDLVEKLVRWRAQG